MNKYQEALKITELLNYASESDKRNGYSTNDVDDAHKSLQELVDRATPRKAIRDFLNTYSCPTCGNSVVENRSCDDNNCRQAIDWSKE